MTRKYGCTNTKAVPGEPRAKFFNAAPLPPIVLLNAWDGPVKDQGQQGSCTANSGASHVEWIWRRYCGQHTVLSAAFLYSEELIRQGNFPSDAGSDPLVTCEVLNSTGICEESLMPYDDKRITMPSEEQVAAAHKYKLGGYHLLNGLSDFLSCLGNPTPWTCVVAFDVPESFESVGPSGDWNPQPNEAIIGGHQVKASGYDIPRKRALMQNSWGAAWGDGGYFWMPFEVLEQATCRIIHPGHW